MPATSPLGMATLWFLSCLKLSRSSCDSQVVRWLRTRRFHVWWIRCRWPVSGMGPLPLRFCLRLHFCRRLRAVGTCSRADVRVPVRVCHRVLRSYPVRLNLCVHVPRRHPGRPDVFPGRGRHRVLAIATHMSCSLKVPCTVTHSNRASGRVFRDATEYQFDLSVSKARTASLH